MSNDLRSVLSALDDQGWTVTKSGSASYRAKPPTAVGDLVIFSTTIESNPRFFQNAIRDLRKSGFQWPPPATPRTVTTTGARTLEPRDPPRLDGGLRRSAASPALALVAVADSVSAPESEPDRLWRELKDAREYAALCVAEHADAMAVMRSAQASVAEADKSSNDAKAALRRAKEAFDRVFSVE